jgi:hypothetical protein
MAADRSEVLRRRPVGKSTGVNGIDEVPDRRAAQHRIMVAIE